jgi:uncharacterized protein
MIVYFDTSALVKRYLRETDSEKVVALLNESDHIFGSIVIARVEMAAAFQKALRLKIVSSAMASEVWDDFLDHWQIFARLRVTIGTIERASDVAWKYGLRGYDSLHLAAALLWQETLDARVTFAAFDHDLLQASQKAGLEPWPAELAS